MKNKLLIITMIACITNIPMQAQDEFKPPFGKDIYEYQRILEAQRNSFIPPTIAIATTSRDHYSDIDRNEMRDQRQQERDKSRQERQAQRQQARQELSQPEQARRQALLEKYKNSKKSNTSSDSTDQLQSEESRRLEYIRKMEQEIKNLQSESK